jgi:tRNA modification GTPase
VLGDTIFAVASPPGAAARGVIRISGPDAGAAAERLLRAPLPRRRAVLEQPIELLGQRAGARLLVIPGPGAYTREDVVELHLPGSPLLLAIAGDALRGAARDATPGEFTRRAFTNGRLNLVEAEAVLALIHAADETERRAAIAALGGGLPELIGRIRGAVQDALGLIEAGLDFERDETGAVDAAEWLASLAAAADLVEPLRAALPPAFGAAGFLLRGAPSAGKSSLCNALAGRPAMLVDAAPGTTRDLVTVDAGDGIRLWDAPGGESGGAPAARALAELLVIDPTTAAAVPAVAAPLAVVLTHADRGPGAPPPLPPAPVFRVSNVSGAGIAELRAFLAAHARSGPSPRARHAESLRLCGERLGAAAAIGRSGDADELAAFELRAALAALDEIDGRSTPEDLLDRVFARFCLGK